MTSGTNKSQSAIYRMATLPVVNSAYVLVSVLYCDTKRTHPYIKSMCDVVETGVKSITSVAYEGAAPIFFKLEPQILVVNELACKGLDKLESAFPVLHKPSEQIVSSAKSMMLEARAAVSIAIHGAKDCVLYTIVGLAGRTKGVLTETFVLIEAGGLNVVPIRRAARLASDGLDSALSMSEILVDQALPPTDEEMEEQVKTVTGFELVPARPGNSARLVSLTTKLCRRAYRQTAANVHSVRVHSRESISLLRHSMDLDKLGGLLRWTNLGKQEVKETEKDVFHSLVAAAGHHSQLHTSNFSLSWSLNNLPSHLQQQALCMLLCASQIYNNFSGTAVQDHTLTLASLDGILDYLVHNTPLNWLVGPSFSRKGPVSPSCPESKKASSKASTFQKRRSAPFHQH
ncbi:perilipin-2 isoform X2 [Hypomesus transpacificus]|uniref:perilipin-2 isoform X2 n=1 Tax=Hypomesus transpacificus TaxID=137520 RepID=UPI001F07C4C2|nr:perilipin-2 isoform X2 [Hypomesus transpacificus]